jgi:hypothetical protein
MDKRYERHFSKEALKMANKNLKRCFTSTVLREKHTEGVGGDVENWSPQTGRRVKQCSRLVKQFESVKM